MAKILLVDDDEELADIVFLLLKKEGHTIDMCHSGHDALQILDFSQYELLILDWELGDMDGPDICARFRTGGGISPVLMVTGRNDTDSKIKGLDKGADDYMTKPFEHGELLARVRALLRRQPNIQSDVLDYKGLKLFTREARIAFEGKDLKMQPLELRILELFVRNKGQWFKTEELLTKIWPATSPATPDTLRASINRLRTALQPTGLSESLQSARNLGYRLE